MNFQNWGRKKKQEKKKKDKRGTSFAIDIIQVFKAVILFWFADQMVTLLL